MIVDSKVKKMKTVLESLFRHRRAVAREAYLVWKHFAALPHLASPYRNEIHSRSELNPKNYSHFFDFLQVVGEAIFPSERSSFSEGRLICYPDQPTEDDTDSCWFFLNGIATSPPVALLNGKELARVFRRPIHLIHTPTNSAAIDLVRSFHARTLRKDGDLSRPAFEIIKSALLEKERVVLLGHSQGTIISSYIVRKLLKDPQLKSLTKKLEVYCLAGVADSFRLDPELTESEGRSVPYVEHFANEGDFFAQIGVLAHLERTDGPLFCLDKTGHLLNEHYLSRLTQGEYCNSNSRLFKYVDGGKPTDTDYITEQSQKASRDSEPSN